MTGAAGPLTAEFYDGGPWDGEEEIEPGYPEVLIPVDGQHMDGFQPDALPTSLSPVPMHRYVLTYRAGHGTIDYQYRGIVVR